MSNQSLTIYGIIYKITNKVNNYIYIGQTKNSLNSRWKSHCNKNGCSAIYRAITKYGKHNFEIMQIDIAFSKQELDEKEVYWISHFNSFNRKNGYNLTSGGSFNRKVSEESRKKMSKSKSGNKMPEETKLKISNALKNRVISDQSIEKLKKSKTGMKYDWKNKCYWSTWEKEKYEKRCNSSRKYETAEESKIATSRRRKERRHEHVLKFKEKGVLESILCIDTGKIYKKQVDITRELGVNPTSLYENLIGLNYTAKGYTFKPIFKNPESEGEL